MTLDHLTEEGRELYARHAWENMPPSAELVLLGICEMQDRKKQAQSVILAEGLTVTDKYGLSKPHPAATIEGRCETAIRQGLKALGEIRKANPEEPVDEFADLRQGGSDMWERIEAQRAERERQENKKE